MRVLELKVARRGKMTDSVIHLLAPMRTCFCLCNNVTQAYVTFKYPQERRVLKLRKHTYNDTMKQIICLLEI
jgi:hypothetical protein